MAALPELKATARNRVGKGSARELRRQNQIPAVIYGGKEAPLSIALPYKEAFMRLQAGGFMTNVIELEVDGKTHSVIPKDYQVDPVRDFLVHIDFLRVSKSTLVTLEIPVHFINEAKAPGLVRGGTLNVVRHAVEVNCPAASIPESLTADLDGLEIGDSVHISAITLPANVTPTITDRDFTIATIASTAAARGGEDDEAGDGEAGEA